MSELRPQDRTGGDRPDYHLADEGVAAELDRGVREVAQLVEAGEVARAEALVRLADVVTAIAERYPQVTDVSVRLEVVVELAPAFRAAGWEQLEPFEF